MSSTSASIHARRELARIPNSSGLNLHRRRRGEEEVEKQMEGSNMVL